MDTRSNRERWVDLHRSELASQRAHLEERIAATIGVLSDLSPLIEAHTAQLGALQRQGALANFVLQAAREEAESEWDAIAGSLNVEGLHYNRRGYLTVTTAPIVIGYRSALHYIGRFAVRIKRSSGDVEITNLERRVRAGRVFVDHPHVVSRKPQWADLPLSLRLIARGGVPALVLTIIGRLACYDPLTAACPVESWPLLDSDTAAAPGPHPRPRSFATGRETFVRHRTAEELQALSSLRQEVRALQSRLAREIARAEGAQRELRAVRQQLSALAHLPRRDPADVAAEYDVLLSLPDVAGIDVVDGRVVLKTRTIEIVHRGRRYRLGPFEVDIRPGLGRLQVSSAGPSPSGYPHPHVGAAGEPCYGNITQLVRNALAERQFGTVIMQLLEFLHSYSEHEPYMSIEAFETLGRSGGDPGH